MADSKRNAEFQALIKQRRDKIMDKGVLTNKAPVVRPSLVVPTSGKKKAKVQRAKIAMSSLQNHVRKYN